MKLHVACRLPVAGLVVCLSLVGTVLGQDSGYVPPRFISNGNDGNVSQALMRHPASPLAGGPAAAAGGQFMDAQGNPIVLPASYCESCPGGSGGYCPSGAGGYGDPMAVDFGGYSMDQCGPHYFDISADVVYLRPENPFGDVGTIVSAGAGNPIEIGVDAEDYSPGWRIAGRFDLGPLSVIEGTYMGLYDLGFRQQVVSADVTPGNLDFSLSTVFSNFGIPIPIDTVDDGDVYTFDLESDLQSTEISYRRYWVGFNSRVSGTWLAGARYLRMTEDLTWDIVALAGNSMLETDTENDLVGFQFGGDGWLCLRQGLRIGTEGKVGIYNNRFKVSKSGVFDDVGNAPDDFDVDTAGNRVAFAAETGVTLVADILPSWSIRGGYQVLYINNLSTLAANFDTTSIASEVVNNEADAVYHGFHGGLEYVW